MWSTYLVLCCYLMLSCVVRILGNNDSSLTDSRIVGGTDTTIENVPYQIQLLIAGSFFCGGSIISEYWILTAAHCVYGYVAFVTIRTGTSIRDGGGTVHAVDSVIYHNYYDTEVYDYDIAVVKLAEPIQFDETRQPIILADQDFEIDDGEILQISGWGRLQYLGTLPVQLQVAYVPTIDSVTCLNAYTNINEVTDRMICAGFLQTGGIDACSGDSGGPAVYNNKVIGVVSWGYGCAYPGYPGVYTKVSYFRDWLINTTGITAVDY